MFTRKLLEERMEPILKVNGVTKIYKKNTSKELIAVKDASFVVNHGEVVGFLGPNGAGKSTTIKIISGLASSTEGNVTINGFDIKKDRENAMKYVGGVIESPDMYIDWTGEENLKYFASLHPRDTMDDETTKSMSKKELDEKRVKDVLDIVSMSERKKDKVKTYSLGMKQRLGISQALLNKPKLLILDEPANGLDPAGIKDIRDLLKMLAHEFNMAVLVSSHQLAEMQLMCDRVIIINKGKIISKKKIDEIAENKNGQTIILSTDKPEEAKAMLLEKFQIKAEIKENKLIFDTDIPISQLTKEIILAGININGVQQKEITLEEMFINLTEGGK